MWQSETWGRSGSLGGGLQPVGRGVGVVAAPLDDLHPVAVRVLGERRGQGEAKAGQTTEVTPPHRRSVGNPPNPAPHLWGQERPKGPRTGEALHPAILGIHLFEDPGGAGEGCWAGSRHLGRLARPPPPPRGMDPGWT